MYQRREAVNDWFGEWIEYHQLLHGSKFWVKWDSEYGPKFYQGWIEAFERWGVAKDVAHLVSRLLQQFKAPQPDRHLEWFKDQYFEVRKAEHARTAMPAAPGVSAEERLAAERSRGCPECGDEKTGEPTGWARRRMVLKGFPWAPFVNLYCRCPLGRFRERAAPDRGRGADRAYADLQLHMDLWDGRLAHDSWDWSEAAELPWHDSHGTYRYLGAWRYLTPREAEAYRQPSREEIKKLFTPAPAPPVGPPRADHPEPAPPRPHVASPAPAPADGDEEMIPF